MQHPFFQDHTIKQVHNQKVQCDKKTSPALIRVPVFRRMLILFFGFISVLFISLLSSSSVRAGGIKSLAQHNIQE